jgi:adenylate cyclase
MRGFRVIPAVDVVRGTADLSALAGTVAFVGATAANLHDLLLVPTSRGLPMPGVEVHASAFDTVLQRRFLSPVPGWAVVLLLVLLGSVGGLFAARLKTRWAVPAIVATLLAIAVASFVLFDQGLLLDIVWPSLAVLLAYVGGMVERRVSSEKERRQVTQAFSRYVSRSVVEAILRDPARLRLGGERRRMSVLFSDIRGFTSISERMDPDALVKLLNTYLSRMTDIVFAHAGVLDKYIGDAVMAFWNAPLDQADHPRRAVDTALDMQTALAEMNRAKAFGDVTIGIGVGINTGDVVVGNIGGQQRFEYTVIGDSVNLASRLEALTRTYDVGIIVTDEVRAALGDGYLLRPLDKVAVKGKKEPVLIYEVMARAAQAEAWQRKVATDFATALSAYFSKDFAGAAARCADLLALRPDDGPSKLLKERAEHFQKEPPAPDWDGRWTYTKK